MPLFSTLDLIALSFFLLAWGGYAAALVLTQRWRPGLNQQINGHRAEWMMQMLGRENRIVDAQITAALQNGSAFFASTSLIAAGGALTLLRSTQEILEVVSQLPLGITTTAVQWEAKTIGLCIVFVYAFFKFAWAYRLFNYVAIMVGATPPAARKAEPDAQLHVAKLARLCDAAGRHFNRGQRAFFFALGYLGWFLGPWVLMATSIAVGVILWRRQFAAEARFIVEGGLPGEARK